MSVQLFIRRRRNRQSSEQEHAQNKVIKVLLSLVSLLAILTGITFAAGLLSLAYIANNLPLATDLERMLDPQTGLLLQPTRMFDRTGENQIAVLSPWDAPRIYFPLDQNAARHLPESIIISTVTVMEPGFWKNNGFTIYGLEDPNKHPTIAQKLVFNLLLWNEPTGIRRALRERLLAALVTSRYGKEKVLEWYLNSTDYGHFAYGADAASRYYLGKNIDGITLAEAALLTSINQNPSINPFDTPHVMHQHQVEILELLKTAKVVPDSEIESAKLLIPVFAQQSVSPGNFAPAFTELVISQMAEQFHISEAAHGGTKIITSLDYNLQLSTSCIIQTQFDRMEQAGSAETSTASPGCSDGDLLPPLPLEEKAPGSASAAVLDPQTGQLLALVGDSTINKQSAVLTPQHPGFMLSPFVYLTGFSRGLSPASLEWDLVSAASTGGSAATEEAINSKGPIRLRIAMTGDLVPTGRKIFDQMGPGLIQKTMLPFGLDVSAVQFDDLIETEKRFNVIQLARAYGVFASMGNMAGIPGMNETLPAVINSISENNGRIFNINFGASINSITNPQLSFLMNDIFSVNIPELGRPVSLKTGMTRNKTDAWAVGYTPNRVIAVWTGGNDLTIRPAEGIWQAVIQSAVQQLPPDGWKMPDGIIKLKVCDPSGMLPTSSCPNIVDEIFIDGYQPTQTDTLYHSYAINRETGLLATVFTPDELVENRIFLQIPPEAESWAKSTNLPVPPTQYDSIQPPNPNPDGNITSPKMYDEVNGIVHITGTADGSGFSTYRLQYGQGMNPEEWIQIGTDSAIPVIKGKLADWDTNGLTGLFSLQLMVINKDQSFILSTVQVTLK